jgi:acetoin utilization deacetylase AcuC-like enzyme
VLRRFAPEFILVSAGFDAHRLDPLAGMELTEEGFAKLARVLLRTAHDVCGDRLALLLEGGYDLEALARSVSAVLGEMRGGSLGEPVAVPAGERADLGRVRDIANHYWRI